MYVKVINKPFISDAPVTKDSDIKDVKTAVVGVIKILTSKIYYLPSSHAIRAYKVLVNHLEQHYKEPTVFHDISTIRYLVTNIEMMYNILIFNFLIMVYFTSMCLIIKLFCILDF